VSEQYDDLEVFYPFMLSHTFAERRDQPGGVTG
jgi:hypothetical protein